MHPVHVIADPGDRVSLCGIRNPAPVVAARHVEAHRRGRDIVVCPACIPPVEVPGQLELL